MTAADLVGIDDQENSGLSTAADSQHDSVRSTADQSDETSEARCLAGFDIREFTSAVSHAKSGTEVLNIIQAFSQTVCSNLTGGSSDPAKTSAVNGTGSDAAESCQSLPETCSTSLDLSGSSTGTGMLVAGTKSYSWSSSLPNGSRLDMLASSNSVDEQQERSSMPSVPEAGSVCKSSTEIGDTAAKTAAGSVPDNLPTSKHECSGPELLLPDSRVDAMPSTTRHNSIRTSRDRTAGDGYGAGCMPAETKRTSVSKKLRVGDFLPPQNSAPETTFTSPRISLDQRLRKPRHLSGDSQEPSQFDVSAGTTMSTQPPASASRHLLSSRATSTGSNSSAAVSSTLVRNPPSADTPSFVDSMSCLSSGLLEDTTTSLLPQLPLTYRDISVTSDAAVSSYSGAGMINFAGRIQPRDMSSGMLSLLSEYM